MNNLLKLQDTIFALATPTGNGAISIIRISGEDSFSIVENLFLSLKNKFLSFYIKKKVDLLLDMS